MKHLNAAATAMCESIIPCDLYVCWFILSIHVPLRCMIGMRSGVSRLPSGWTLEPLDKQVESQRSGLCIVQERYIDFLTLDKPISSRQDFC